MIHETALLNGGGAGNFLEDFHDCVDTLPHNIQKQLLRIPTLNLDYHNDSSNNSENSDRVKQLEGCIEHLKANERSLMEKIENFKHLEDLYIKNIVSEHNFSSDLVDLDTINDDNNEPLSSRSDKSISSIANATTLQAALDVFAENNKLLIDKESTEEQLKRLTQCLQDTEIKLQSFESNNSRLEEENLSLKSELESLQRQLNDKNLQVACTGDHQQLSSRIIELQTVLNREQDCLKVAVEEKISLEQDFASLNSNNENLKDEKEALSSQVNDLLKQKASLQSKIDQLKTINQSKEVDSRKVDSLQAENDEQREKLKLYTNKFRELNCELEDCRSKLRIKVEEIDHLRKLLTEKSKENFANEYEVARQNCLKLEQDCKRLTAQNVALQNQLQSVEDLKRALDSQNLGLQNLKEILCLKDGTIKEISKKAEQLESQLTELSISKKELESAVQVSKKNFDDKCQEVDKMQKEFDLFQANAEGQYEMTLLQHEKEIQDLQLLLKKHVEYPGKSYADQSADLNTTPVVQKLHFEKAVSTSSLTSLRDFGVQAQLCDFPALILQLFDLLFVLIQPDLEDFSDHLEAIKAIFEQFGFQFDDHEKILGQLEDIIDFASITLEKNREVREALDHKVKEFERLLHQNSCLEQNYEDNLKRLKSELKIQRNCTKNLENDLEEKCNELASVINAKEKLIVQLEQNHRYKNVADYLEHQSSATIKDLLRQHEEDKTNVESLSAEVTKLRNELEKKMVDTVAYENLRDTCFSLEEQTIRYHEENRTLKVALSRYRYFRQSLICQKKFLLVYLDDYDSLKQEILEFFRNHGFLPPSNSTRFIELIKDTSFLRLKTFRKRSFKLKMIAFIILACLKIRNQYEKHRYLMRQNGSNMNTF